MVIRYEEARAQLEEQRSAVAACDAELKALMAEKLRATEAAGKAEIEVKKLGHALARFGKKSAGAEKSVAAMLKKFPWIKSERQCVGRGGGLGVVGIIAFVCVVSSFLFPCLLLQLPRDARREELTHVLCGVCVVAAATRFFGKPHTDYDFEANDTDKALARMDKLDSKLTKLGKKLNKKVVGMIETAEKEYRELMKKKRIIENDKVKIEVRVD